LVAAVVVVPQPVVAAQKLTEALPSDRLKMSM